MIEEIAEEAEIRGMPVRRVTCRPDALFGWLEAHGLANTPEARRAFATEQADRAGPTEDTPRDPGGDPA